MANRAHRMPFYRRFHSLLHPKTSLPSQKPSTPINNRECKSPYIPCLFLRKNQDCSNTNQILYTFYSLRDDKIMQKKQKIPPLSEENAAALFPKNSAFVGSSHGWLAFSSPPDEPDANNPRSVCLTNPSLPNYSCRIFKVLGLSNDISKIALSSALKPLSPQSGLPSSSPINFAFYLPPNVIMGLLDDVGRIAFGGNHPYKSFPSPYLSLAHFAEHQAMYSWSDADYSDGHGYLDAWYCDYSCAKEKIPNKIFTTFNLSDEKVSALKEWKTRFSVEAQSYLVESMGNLLLVSRFIAPQVAEDGTLLSAGEDPSACFYTNKAIHFDVYRMDFEREEWDPVDDLGECALFVGRNDSLSILCSTDEFPYLKKNSIYFAGNGSMDVETFELGDGSIDRIVVGDDENGDREVSSNNSWVMVGSEGLYKGVPSAMQFCCNGGNIQPVPWQICGTSKSNLAIAASVVVGLTGNVFRQVKPEEIRATRNVDWDFTREFVVAEGQILQPERLA